MCFLYAYIYESDCVHVEVRGGVYMYEYIDTYLCVLCTCIYTNRTVCINCRGMHKYIIQYVRSFSCSTYTHTYVHTYIHTYVCIHARTYDNMCVYIFNIYYTYIHICIRTYIHICIYTYICIYVYTHACMHAYIHKSKCT